MQQLTAMDAVFLSMETRETPGHIGGLALLDPTSHPENAFEFDAFVDFVAERLALCPRFGWRLQEVPLGLDRPYWVEVEGLDLKRHIQRLALPAPSGTGELSRLASFLFERPLDRGQPLWEMFFVEGLEGGRIALLWKVHHSLLDGVSGAGLVEMLFDVAPVPADKPLLTLVETATAGPEVGGLEMAARGLRNAAERPVALLRHVSRIGRQVLGQLRDEGLDGVSTAPRMAFNATVGTRRSVGWSRVSFERVKDLKNDLDVTVNDVVLAITGDAMRRYLDKRGELPAESLVAAVPVSLREKGDRSIGNKISEVGISWGTHIEDPVARVLAIHESGMQVKRSAKAKALNPMQLMADSMAPGALQILMRGAAFGAEHIPLPANAVVSNVPMTPMPLYIAGARMESLVPMSLLAPTQGFNITVVSYCGELHFGVIADPVLFENVWEIADAIPKALLELEEGAAANHPLGGVPSSHLSESKPGH